MADDVPALAVLSYDVLGASSIDWLEVLGRDVARHDRTTLVAEVAGTVVGLLRVAWYGPAGSVAADGDIPAGPLVIGLFVVDRHRRTGIARALLEAAVDWSRGRGTVVRSFTEADNVASLAAHRAAGFLELTRDFRFPGVTTAGGSHVLLGRDLPAVDAQVHAEDGAEVDTCG